MTIVERLEIKAYKNILKLQIFRLKTLGILLNKPRVAKFFYSPDGTNSINAWISVWYT
jgi:hypothetical protein